MTNKDSSDNLPMCTVVVCTHNRPRELDDCLKAIANLTYPTFEVLIVDNAPRDDRVRAVAEKWHARYTVEPMPGLSRARNRGARESCAEIVAYLDDDAVPNPDWLRGLAIEFVDPRVMVVAGSILPLRVETEAQRFFNSWGEPYGSGPNRRVVDRENPDWFEITNFGGVGGGGNMAFRRSAFDLWPGFDERLGRGALLYCSEEHYAFFSLVERGYNVVQTPYAVVKHPYPESMEELRTWRLKTLAAGAAYMTLLLFEQPGYRRFLFKYFARSLWGAPPAWRSSCHRGGGRQRIAPQWRVMLAYLSGPLIYFRSRFHRGSSKPA